MSIDEFNSWIDQTACFAACHQMDDLSWYVILLDGSAAKFSVIN